MTRLRDLKGRPRQIYGRNPLVEVVAAVQFPPQLALEQQLPVRFQDAIKQDYPFLRLKTALMVPAISIGDDQQAARQQASSRKIYEFCSEDQKRVVSVSLDNLALTTTVYTRWEEFLPSFMRVVEVFREQYNVPLFTRVGLRYKDVIDREALGLKDVPWDGLIQPELLAPAAFFSSDLEQSPAFTATVHVELPGSRMNVNCGFVENLQKRIGFLIDTDCYVEPASIRTPNDVGSTLEGLHRYTSLAFSAAITDKLHTALQPSS